MEPKDCNPSNATRRWHHDANNENKPWTIDVQKVSGNEFWDVETNTVIPQFQIEIITSRLLEAGQIIKRAQRAWDTAIKANCGDKKAARKESDKILLGGKTKLFDQLSADNCLVTMRIVGPPLILTGLNDREIAQTYKEFPMGYA